MINKLTDLVGTYCGFLLKSGVWVGGTIIYISRINRTVEVGTFDLQQSGFRGGSFNEIKEASCFICIDSIELIIPVVNRDKKVSVEKSDSRDIEKSGE